LAPAEYGILAGATLHEVAQVVAAVTPVPDVGDWSSGRFYPPAEAWPQTDGYSGNHMVAAIRDDLCALFDLEMMAALTCHA
jgi:hypothetical protein